MTSPLRTVLVLLLLAATGSAATAQAVPLPTLPAPAGRLHTAIPVRLEQPFAYEWRKERPAVDAGWLLVVDVDPACVFPRQVAEPVLYVGQEVAMRYNVGVDAGRLVLFVPAALDEAGRPALDLARAPIFFGAAELPERITAARATAERDAARVAGLGPRPAAELEPVLERAGPVRTLADRTALDRAAARLILRWIPEEEDLGRLLLAPPPERATRP